jgi:hypothetical protein
MINIDRELREAFDLSGPMTESARAKIRALYGNPTQVAE